jgi:hypothetical protein
VPPPGNALQLKITLRYLKPPIWRRVVVPDNYTLSDLHYVIQRTMGWMGGHMHAFRVARQGFGPNIDLPGSAPLQRVLDRKARKILYEYDFGDGWLHEILLEKLLPFDAKAVYPQCLAGARACPPEDCGGVGGYCDLLDALANPTAANASLREWAGNKFDPEAFDAAAVNQSLGRRRRG